MRGSGGGGFGLKATAVIVRDLLGKKHGAPGEKLDVPCGRTFVRVGKAPGPSWLSAGTGLKVECQSVTEITLDEP